MCLFFVYLVNTTFPYVFIFFYIVFHWGNIIKKLFSKVEGLGEKIKREDSHIGGLSIEARSIVLHTMMYANDDLRVVVNTIKNLFLEVYIK